MSDQVAEIFPVDHKIMLFIEEAKYPLRFQPWLRKCDGQTMELELPDQWWKFATFLPDMRIELSLMREECIYGLKGKILEAQHDPPRLRVEHDNQVERIQRRTYYRLEHRAAVMIAQAVLPEGRDIGPLAAKVQDISLGGVGLKLKQFIPPETKIKLEKLLDAFVSPSESGTAYTLKVQWCRVNRPEGFRLGAKFEFQNIEEYERMERIIHELHSAQLSRYQTVLGQV